MVTVELTWRNRKTRRVLGMDSKQSVLRRSARRIRWIPFTLKHLSLAITSLSDTLWKSQASEKPESIYSPRVVIKNPQLRGTRIVVVTDSGSITCFEDADKGAIAENEQSR